MAGLETEFLAETAPGGFPIRIAASVSGPIYRELLGSEQPDLSRLSPAGWADVSQERAERILARRAVELGAELRFGTELVSFEQDADGVTAVLRDLSTGATSSVRAEYLVAADGHHGPIRSALGIGGHGRGALGTAASALFEAELGESIGTRGALYYLQNPQLPGNGGALVTTDAPGRYVLNTGLEDGVSPTTARWVELIRIATGVADLRPTLLNSNDRVFATEHRIADEFSSGRVHLIGDAARVMPPTGGLGGNTAILDGYHLAWKLAMVVRGEAGPGLLASHDPERRP
ncbi:MAG TPA: FAD-dependent monooxygenase [Pseudonocardiaceae bacterium]|nr:FAD-dependent monooxygenase [Pseudonocardiaceae bacterium]